MRSNLPRALEFQIVGEEHLHVRVDAHVFIYRITADGRDLALCRVRRGGRRAFRSSEAYEGEALEFARREALARGLLSVRHRRAPS